MVKQLRVVASRGCSSCYWESLCATLSQRGGWTWIACARGCMWGRMGWFMPRYVKAEKPWTEKDWSEHKSVSRYDDNGEEGNSYESILLQATTFWLSFSRKFQIGVHIREWLWMLRWTRYYDLEVSAKCHPSSNYFGESAESKACISTRATPLLKLDSNPT